LWVARRRRADRFYACGALQRPRAARSTRTLGVMSIARNAAWVFGSLLALSGLVFGGLWFLGARGCGNQVLSEVASPDRNLRIVVFQRDCGATTGFSTQASLLEFDQALGNGSGNIFIADTDHGSAPGGPGGGPDLHAVWEDNRSVTLSYDSRVRIFKAEQQIHGVSFTYQPIGS